MLRCAFCGVLRQAVEGTLEWYGHYYAALYHNGVYTHSYEHDRNVAVKRLQRYALPPGTRLLDVGAGNGAFVDAANERGLRACGQEPGWCVHESVYVGDLVELGFPAGAFDCVTMHDVLEHVPDPKATLAEVRRVLAPNGLFLLDFPRFHHESGAHHWKPVEHLWMLETGQLSALLDECGFAVERLDHPIDSKVVLYARRRPEKSVRVLVPPGIGDGWWVAAKLRGWAAAHGLGVPEVWVHDAGPRRSAGLWSRLPFARWGGYATGLDPKLPEFRRAYVGTSVVQQDVYGFDFLLSFNGTLGVGASLDEAMPDVPTEWDLPLFASKEETSWCANALAAYGSYVVTGWWSHGMYRAWVRHWGHAKALAALRRIADRGYTVLLTGADWDSKNMAASLAGTDRRFVNLIGKTTFDALTGLVRGSTAVFGFPAGSTLLGPFFGKPSLLLWSHRFPVAMWRHACPPHPHYSAVGVEEANDPVHAADSLCDLIDMEAE